MPKPKTTIAETRPVRVIEIMSESEARQAAYYEFEECNASELVHICHLLGLEADRSIAKDNLIEMVLEGYQLFPVGSWIQSYRRLLADGFKTRSYFLTHPVGCPKRCQEHPDLLVLQCGRTFQVEVKQRIEVASFVKSARIAHMIG